MSSSLRFLKRSNNIVIVVKQHKQSRSYATATTSTSSAASETINSSDKPVVTVFGGSGQVGKVLVEKIAPRCKEVIVACRYPDNYKTSQKNVHVEKVNVADKHGVYHLCEGSDYVINLVNTVHEIDNTLSETFIDGSKHIAHGAAKANAQRLIKLSYLGADVDHPSYFLDFAYRGEDITYAAYPDATILRSSLIFGQGSYLFDKIVKGLSKYPVIPMPRATGRYQPVWANDVADAIVKVLEDEHSQGRVYKIGGPKQYGLSDMIQTALKYGNGSSRPSFPIPYGTFDLSLVLRQLLPEPLINRDHTPMLNTDMSVPKDAEYTLQSLQIQPSSMEDVLPSIYRGQTIPAAKQ